MSHIPSAAIPHAKTHEQEPTTPVATKGAAKRFAWLALVGGALAIGTAVGAAIVLRPAAKPVRRRSTAAKSTRRRATKAKPRRREAKAVSE